VAPQLVTPTEKSPALSSYTPTIFLPAAALAEPAAAAHAHSSARSSGALAMIIGQRRMSQSAVAVPCAPSRGLRLKKDDERRQEGRLTDWASGDSCWNNGWGHGGVCSQSVKDVAGMR
jgi:hypothetical protein